MKTLQHFHFGQTANIVSALSLLFATTQFAPLAAPPAKEKFIVPAAPITIEFPPKPESATDTLTISSPSVVIDDSIAAKFGGQAVTKMAVPSLENLLNNSGRFTVLLDGDAPYKIKVTITSLKIGQTTTKKGAGASEIIKVLVPKFAGKNKIDPELADLMTVDWSKDDVMIKAECSITLQILDKDSRLIVGNTGCVSRESTVASLRGEFGGVTFGKVAAPADSGMDSVVPAKLIELAAYESLKQSIPAIDRELLRRKAVVANEPQNISQTSGVGGAGVETQTLASKAKFCGECGLTVAPANKFCTACGKPLRK